jgi:CrcB protein
MFSNILLVGLGGGMGSILRYLCQRSLNETRFPFGTLLVNIVGCLLIGILMGAFPNQLMNQKNCFG